MSWHYLQEGAEASWPGNSLDGAPSALLKLIPTPEASSLPDSATESLSHSRCGMMSPRSTASLGVEVSMSSPQGSRVKTSASAEKAKASRDRGLDSGKKPQELLARYCRVSSSWKIARCLPVAGLELSLETWPPSGSMRNGECFRRQRAERPISESGFTFLLTPTANSWKAWTFRNLRALIRKNHADGNLQEQLARLFLKMTTPQRQEILMNWPKEWTASASLATDGFQQWLQEHSRHSHRESQRKSSPFAGEGEEE